MGPSVAKSDRRRSSRDVGEAAQTLEEVQARCMLGGVEQYCAQVVVLGNDGGSMAELELGLSVENVERERDPGETAGGAAQSLEGVRVRCVPGGDGVPDQDEINSVRDLTVKIDESGRAKCGLKLGLSVKKSDSESDTGGAGGATQTLEGVRTECTPGIE